MTGVGDQPRDFAEFVGDTRKRLVALERRQIGAGGGGGGGAYLQEGPGIHISGSGSSGSPYIISAEAPPLPTPQVLAGGAPFTLTLGQSVWQDIPGMILTMTPSRDLWLRIDFTAMTYATTGYTAIGVAYSMNGGAYSVPQDDPMAGAGAFGQTPFNVVRENATGQTGLRVLRLTAGVVYSFKMQAMRSATTGSQQANYAIMRLIPMYWVDVPVPVRVTQGALTRRLSATPQAVTTGVVGVLFGTSVVDSGHFTYNPANGVFTCVVPGTYRISGTTGFSTASGSFIAVAYRVNGVNVANVIATRSSLQVGVPITVSATLAAGDTVDVVYQSNVAGGNTDTTGPRTFIELVPVTQDIETIPAAELDTGWTQLTLNSGWSHVGPGLRARRIGCGTVPASRTTDIRCCEAGR